MINLKNELISLDEYISDSTILTTDLVMENERKILMHSEFIKKPVNLEEHIALLQ